MRVSPVSNYRKNNVAFGKFADENARTTVKKALTTNDRVMKPTYESWFERIEKCDFFEAYTDKNSGEVKGEFNDEFVKNNDDIAFYVKVLKKWGTLDNLSIFSNLKVIADQLFTFQRILKGEDIYKELYSKNPHGDLRDEEQISQEKLNGLAD